MLTCRALIESINIRREMHMMPKHNSAHRGIMKCEVLLLQGHLVRVAGCTVCCMYSKCACISPLFNSLTVLKMLKKKLVYITNVCVFKVFVM